MHSEIRSLLHKERCEAQLSSNECSDLKQLSVQNIFALPQDLYPTLIGIEYNFLYL